MKSTSSATEFLSQNPKPLNGYSSMPAQLQGNAAESRLIGCVNDGDADAFYELVRPYERAVFLAALSIVKNDADAEEVAQEAVLKAFKGLSRFRQESKFSTWLIQITINEARMKSRKNLRQLLRHRHKMVCLRTSVRNQLHALAMGQGVYRKRKLWTAGGRSELEALGLDPWASRRRQELLDILDRLDPSLAELDRAVAKEAEQRPAACCLMKQPGVGPVTALMFVLTIGPVERFARSKQVVSYLGLNPRESSSGGRQRLGAISKQGNSMARFLLVEAAQTAARYDEELRRDYQRLKFRRGTAVAKVAIARKLAVRLYWKLRKLSSPEPSARMQGSPEHPVVGASLSRN